MSDINKSTNHHKEWDVFWKLRKRSLLGKFVRWVRDYFVTPRLINMVLDFTKKWILVEAVCSTGEISIAIAKARRDSPILVDIATDALESAWAAAEAADVPAHIIQCDIAELSTRLKREEVNTAFNIGVIEHFPDITDVVREMVKVFGQSAFSVVPEYSVFWVWHSKISSLLGLKPSNIYVYYF